MACDIEKLNLNNILYGLKISAESIKGLGALATKDKVSYANLDLSLQSLLRLDSGTSYLELRVQALEDRPDLRKFAAYKLISTTNGNLIYNDGLSSYTFLNSENSDNRYALINHTHDNRYALKDHTHEGMNSGSHTHPEYASVNHIHTEYADVLHNHNELYAKINHTHNLSDINDINIRSMHINSTTGLLTITDDLGNIFSIQCGLRDSLLKYDLSFIASPLMGGYISADGTVTNGGKYVEGQVLKLTPLPAQGYRFDKWDNGSLVAERTLVVSKNEQAIAFFVKDGDINTINITVDYNNTLGAILGIGKYAPNDVVVLQAIPLPGYRFVGWYLNGVLMNSSQELQFVANANIRYTALFQEVPSDTFTVVLTPSPKEGGTCKGAGAFHVGTQAIVEAVPNQGWEFVNWSDGISDRIRIITEEKTLAANFRQSSSDYVTVTNASPNCISSNTATTVKLGSPYITTISAASGYKIDSIVCTMGGVAVSVINNQINIPSVTGSINIAVTTSKIQLTQYTVTYNLTNCSSSNTATSVLENSPYKTTILPPLDDAIHNTVVSCTMGGVAVNVTNNEIDILRVTGDIVITAISTMVEPSYYLVTYNLTNCTSSNTATMVFTRNEFHATISAVSGYTLGTVTCTMGGVAQSVSNGVISIASVTGHIVITASATKNVVEKFTLSLSVNPVGAGIIEGSSAGTYNKGTQLPLNAIANDGYEFVNWSDGSTSAGKLITLNSNISLTANFKLAEPELYIYYGATYAEPFEDDFNYQHTVAPDDVINLVVAKALVIENVGKGGKGYCQFVAIPLSTGLKTTKWIDQNDKEVLSTNIKEMIVDDYYVVYYKSLPGVTSNTYTVTIS